MFTGIITHIGTVSRIKKSGDWKFTIDIADFTHDLAIGASVSHNGVCLTVITKDKNSFTVQVSAETLSCTSLGTLKEGSRINLERALKVGDELGGHFVSGHVDGLATLKTKEQDADSFILCLSAPVPLSRFIAEKGSVTLDGISLTVNKVAGNDFWVNIIPHTMEQTTLGERKVGDTLNIEVDIIARYLAKLHN